MLSLITAAAVAASAPTIRNHGVQPTILRDALRAPESPRRAGESPRYCAVVESDPKVASPRVCRTRSEWVKHGVEPVIG